MSEKVTSNILRLRKTFITLWILLALLAALSSINISSRLTTSIEIPGSQSHQTEKILNRAFHETSEGLITVINKFGTLSDSEIESLKSKTTQAVEIIPSAQIVQQQAIAGTLFTLISTNSSLAVTAQYIVPLRSELRSQGLNGALVSGPPAIYNDVRPVLSSDLRRGEIIAIFLTLSILILALGFNSSIFIPLLFAATVVSLVLGIVNLIAHFFTMILYIPNIVELVGFGLSMDYSLLAIQRYREELLSQENPSRNSAIISTMRTAGKTILISSSTVAISMATLLFFPIPFIQSLGIAGVLVPLVALIASISFLPVLLYFLGGAPDKTQRFTGFLARTNSKSQFWSAHSRILQNKPKQIFISSVILLAVLGIPLFSMQVTPSSLTALPSSLESSKALSYVTSRVGEGVITPIVLIADFGAQGKALENSASRVALTTSISKDASVFTVASGERPPYVDPTGRYMRIFVFGKEVIGSSETQKLVEKIRVKYLADSTFVGNPRFYVGGAPTQGVDLLREIYRYAPVIFGAFIIIIFLLLGKTYRSVLIPLKAIILDICSIAASLGVLVFITSSTLGSRLFGTYQLSQLEVWVIVFLVVILFGISMDYELFIVSRIHESWLTGTTNQGAVIEGFSKTIRVVTTAAAIFVAAVSGFIGSHFAGLQELGVGLVFAVLIDATLIRLFLLPSAMILIGKLNWWFPGRKSRHLIK